MKLPPQEPDTKMSIRTAIYHATELEKLLQSINNNEIKELKVNLVLQTTIHILSNLEAKQCLVEINQYKRIPEQGRNLCGIKSN